MNGERHFKGTLSFALAHTQACYKDSEPFTIFTYRGFSFLLLISVAYHVNKRGKPWPSRPDQSLEQAKILNLYCHFDRKITAHTLSVCQYTSLLCVNTAKDI